MDIRPPGGGICPTCGEWVPSNRIHRCSGVRIPRMPTVGQHVIVTLWQVNTLTPDKKATLTGLSALGFEARLQLLDRALDGAARAMARRDDRYGGRALRIFVAPEFYFSNQRAHFFDEETKERIRGSLIALSRKYPEILIIPGTVAWYKTWERSASRAWRKVEEHGAPAAPRKFSKYHALYKKELDLDEAPSAAAKYMYEQQAEYRARQVCDFGARMTGNDPTLKVAHNTVFVLYHGKIWHKYNKRFEAIGKEDLSLEVPEDSDYRNIVFPPTETLSTIPSIKGVRIGVEVCVDHEHGALLSAGRNHDIHIVCSATVSVFREHAAVVDRGYVVQADAESAGVYRPSDLPSSESEDGAVSRPLAEVENAAGPGTIYLSDFWVNVPNPRLGH